MIDLVESENERISFLGQGTAEFGHQCQIAVKKQNTRYGNMTMYVCAALCVL